MTDLTGQRPGASLRPEASLRLGSPLSLLRSGRRAFREVPGLRLFLLTGLALNYAVFLLVGGAVMAGLYFFVVQPLGASLGAWSGGEGFLAGLLSAVLTALLWLTQLLLMAASLLLSFLLALSLMTLWFEALAGRIVAHCRGGTGSAEEAFSLGAWLKGLGRSLKDGLRLILLSFLALLLGFIPVVGPFLVIGINSYLLGWEIREPYLAVRESSHEARRNLRRGTLAWTISAGFLPVVLALVPLLGWLLLPAALIYLVAGVAWQAEQGRSR